MAWNIAPAFWCFHFAKVATIFKQYFAISWSVFQYSQYFWKYYFFMAQICDLKLIFNQNRYFIGSISNECNIGLQFNQYCFSTKVKIFSNTLFFVSVIVLEIEYSNTWKQWSKISYAFLAFVRKGIFNQA